jgi:hypothetical protein
MRGTVLFTRSEKDENSGEDEHVERLHHFSPATFEQRASEPFLENGQAALWLTDGSKHGDGDVVLTIKDSQGTSKSVLLADFSTLP